MKIFTYELSSLFFAIHMRTLRQTTDEKHFNEDEHEYISMKNVNKGGGKSGKNKNLYSFFKSEDQYEYMTYGKEMILNFNGTAQAIVKISELMSFTRNLPSQN